jgi:hypothetical protein
MENQARDKTRIATLHDHQLETRHNHSEPSIRTPSVDLPLFHGDNAATWILECEGIFDLAGIDNEHKIKWANAHIRGKAKTWLSSSNL